MQDLKDAWGVELAEGIYNSVEKQYNNHPSYVKGIANANCKDWQQKVGSLCMRAYEQLVHSTN